MGWVLLSTLALLGSSSCNGMGAVEYPNPIGFQLLWWDGCCEVLKIKKDSTAQVGAKKELNVYIYIYIIIIIDIINSINIINIASIIM